MDHLQRISIVADMLCLCLLTLFLARAAEILHLLLMLVYPLELVWIVIL